MTAFLKANWFTLASVIFMAGTFFAAQQGVAARLTALETVVHVHSALPSHPATEMRLARIEADAERDAAQSERFQQALADLSANIAALCQATNARCR